MHRTASIPPKGLLRCTIPRVVVVVLHASPVNGPGDENKAEESCCDIHGETQWEGTTEILHFNYLNS